MIAKTYRRPNCGRGVVTADSWKMMRLVAVAMLAVAHSGCAYLNGDAMWLGKDQKSVRVSNTLMTWFNTEYDIRAWNLPFHFVCLPSEVPYEFQCRFETNSVFKICFPKRLNEADCECVEVRCGVAKVFKRDGSGWTGHNSSSEENREVTDCCGMDVFISPVMGDWRVWIYTRDGRGRYAEGVFPKEKLISPQKLIVEECENVKLWHQSNWYEW